MWNLKLMVTHFHGLPERNIYDVHKYYVKQIIWHVASQLSTYLSRRSFCFFTCKISFCSLACSDFRTSICVLCTIPLPPPQVRGVWDCGVSASFSTGKQIYTYMCALFGGCLKPRQYIFMPILSCVLICETSLGYKCHYNSYSFFHTKHTSQYPHYQGDIKKHDRFFTGPFRGKIVIVPVMS